MPPMDVLQVHVLLKAADKKEFRSDASCMKERIWSQK
jgi:hypothetical protein